jgi:hypothetical protein
MRVRTKACNLNNSPPTASKATDCSISSYEQKGIAKRTSAST